MGNGSLKCKLSTLHSMPYVWNKIITSIKYQWILQVLNIHLELNKMLLHISNFILKIFGFIMTCPQILQSKQFLGLKANP